LFSASAHSTTDPSPARLSVIQAWQGIGSAVNPKPFSHDQSLGYQRSRLRKHPTIGLTGYVHVCCSAFVVHLFEIAEPQRFKTLNRKHNIFHESTGDTFGPKRVGHGASPYESQLSASWHGVLLF
jgi:hypothetical protein